MTGLAVLGAGAWGTALAQAMAMGDAGADVLLWAREPDVAAAINRAHENARFLPDVPLSPRIRATSSLADCAAADLWLVVPPAQHLRAVLGQAPLAHRPALVLCSKGIEAGSHLLMGDVASEIAPGSPVAILSGPSFAADVARGLPAAVTLGAATLDEARTLARRIMRPALRPYITDDRIGCEIGGAVKNVLAIACGVVIGAGLGESARAAVIARGFAEMTRYGVARGGRAETLAGLSGLGDLVLTCSSTLSRNMRLGIALGQGQPLDAALAGLGAIAEGAATAPVLTRSAQALGVEMPIADAVARLLAGEVPARQLIDALLARPLRPEGA